jgi:hypothetical protein
MEAIPEEWKILTSDQIRQLIVQHLHEDPADFAIRHAGEDFPYALVSTQLKYLQRARLKLPSWYAVQAIIPALAYEQASSEATARLKRIEGQSCLDLTMGLGVDAHYLAQQVSSVVALEANVTLADIVRYNYTLLDQVKVAVHASSAETFVSTYRGPRFDWIYVDPARRDAQGARVQGLRQGQPDVVALHPRLRQLGRRLLVKASPLLDLQAAARLLPGVCKLSVHSVHREVKEVLIEVDLASHAYLPPDHLPLSIVLSDGTLTQSFRLSPWTQSDDLPAASFQPSYLAEPDPAFYQAQCLPQLYQQYLSAWSAGLAHPMGYFFSATFPPETFPGRRFRLLQAWPYKPKALKQALKQAHLTHAHVMRRDFPLSVKQIRQQLALPEGGHQYLICSTWQGKKWAWLAERITAPGSPSHAG